MRKEEEEPEFELDPLAEIQVATPSHHANTPQGQNQT
jgi:hypothetical protein